MHTDTLVATSQHAVSLVYVNFRAFDKVVIADKLLTYQIELRQNSSVNKITRRIYDKVCTTFRLTHRYL